MMRALAAVLGLAAATQAAAACLQPDTLWSCIGQVEIRSITNGDPVRLKMVYFAGGDLLAEVDKAGVRSTALAVQPSGAILYHGIDVAEADSPRGPFMFFNEAIGWGAFFPLQSAYPAGPASVPEENSEKTVRIQNQTLTLVTTRLGPQRIAFSYEFAGSPARVDGTWDCEPPAALPDDYALAGWRHKGGAPLSVLGAARALPPAGR